MVLAPATEWYAKKVKVNPLIVYRFDFDTQIEVLTIDDVTALNNLFTFHESLLTFHLDKIDPNKDFIVVDVGDARRGMFIYGLPNKEYALWLVHSESSMNESV